MPSTGSPQRSHPLPPRPGQGDMGRPIHAPNRTSPNPGSENRTPRAGGPDVGRGVGTSPQGGSGQKVAGPKPFRA